MKVRVVEKLSAKTLRASDYCGVDRREEWRKARDEKREEVVRRLLPALEVAVKTADPALRKDIFRTAILEALELGIIKPGTKIELGIKRRTK